MKFSAVERRYAAIIWAIEHYRAYLIGVKFTAATDSSPLQWFLQCFVKQSRGEWET